MSDRNHLLPFPKWTLVLRGLQLVFAIVILGLAAYGINYSPLPGGFPGIDLNLFTATASIIAVVYILVSFFTFPIAYSYWAVLGLDILAVVFWLVSFALLAAEVQAYKTALVELVGTCAYEFNGVCYDKRALIEKRFITVHDYYNAMIATAVFGALEFVLFTMTLIWTSLSLHHHRTASDHYSPGSVGPDESGTQRKPVGGHEDGNEMANF